MCFYTLFILYFSFLYIKYTCLPVHFQLNCFPSYVCQAMKCWQTGFNNKVQKFYHINVGNKAERSYSPLPNLVHKMSLRYEHGTDRFLHLFCSSILRQYSSMFKAFVSRNNSPSFCTKIPVVCRH